MEPKQIRELIELISQSDFSEFELERDDFKIKLVRQQPAAAAPLTPVTTHPAPRLAAEAPSVRPQVEPVEEIPQADDGLVELKSPIVGTFYRSPGPELPPFVEIGSKAKKGQTLCIVEAMKVMNEIDSEIDAEVVDVPLTTGQPVEFGEVLFRLRPLN